MIGEPSLDEPEPTRTLENVEDMIRDYLRTDASSVVRTIAMHYVNEDRAAAFAVERMLIREVDDLLDIEDIYVDHEWIEDIVLEEVGRVEV